MVAALVNLFTSTYTGFVFIFLVVGKFVVYFYYSKKRVGTGIKCGNQFISFRSMFQDVRDTIDYLHGAGVIKTCIRGDLNLYVINNGDRLRSLLTRIRDRNARIFLLTNSNYDYAKVYSYSLSKNFIKSNFVLKLSIDNNALYLWCRLGSPF